MAAISEGDEGVSELLTYYRGRVALYALLRALGIGKGDTVALQAFTCVAVPEGILAAGAKPLFVDIEEGGVNVDLGSLRQRLRTDTRAIVVQHTFGVAADIRGVLALGQERGIPVIEDCCHVDGSTLDGTVLGGFGVGAFYSYEWGKPVVVGIGGRAVANDVRLRGRLQEEYGVFRRPGLGASVVLTAQYLAFKTIYRPTFYWTIRAAFHAFTRMGLAEGNYHALRVGTEPSREFSLRMERGARWRLQRRLRRGAGSANLAESVGKEWKRRLVAPGVCHVRTPNGARTAYARYPVFVCDKESLLSEARRSHLEVSAWYATPVHPLKPAQFHVVGYEEGACPNAERAARRVVSLPTRGIVDEHFMERVVALFERALSKG